MWIDIICIDIYTHAHRDRERGVLQFSINGSYQNKTHCFWHSWNLYGMTWHFKFNNSTDEKGWSTFLNTTYSKGVRHVYVLTIVIDYIIEFQNTLLLRIQIHSCINWERQSYDCSHFFPSSDFFSVVCVRRISIGEENVANCIVKKNTVIALIEYMIYFYMFI